MKTKKKNPSVPQILVLGYLFLIVIGSILLWLPISYQTGKEVTYLDALFTAVSSACVTGLISVDTGTTWTMFGKIIIISLIQIGGLGLLAFVAFFQVTLRQRLGLRQRLIIQQDLNSFDLHHLEKMIAKVIFIALGIETIGALVLSTQFIPMYGVAKGLGYSFFHAISAFCNAGFDLFGDFQSITAFQTNPVILYTLGFLIIAGGLGFIVWIDLATFLNKKMKTQISFHTKIVLITTIALLLASCISIGFLEYDGAALAHLTPIDKINNIIFLAITPRTAGFSNIDLSTMQLGTSLITIVLMFIGGSSGSTAGGIKTTTLAVIALVIYGVLRGRRTPRVLARSISLENAQTAFTVATLGIIAVTSATIILSITDAQFSLLTILFETVSAFGTVGSSLSMTPALSLIGKIVIMLLMYLGRVGPITFGLSVLIERQNLVNYPKGQVLIG